MRCKDILVELNNDGHLKRKASEAFMCGVIALACRDADDPSTARSAPELLCAVIIGGRLIHRSLSQIWSI